MKLFFVRHGETDDNVNLLLSTEVVTPLNEEGKKQAQKIGSFLKKESFDIAYTSDMIRAQQTANEILKHHKGVEVNVTKKLRERHGGVFSGKPINDYDVALEENGSSFLDFKPEGGESMQETNERVKEFYHYLIDNHSDENILIVGHGMFFNCLFLYLYGVPLNKENIKKFKHDNCEFSIVEVDENKDHKIHTLSSSVHMG